MADREDATADSARAKQTARRASAGRRRSAASVAQEQCKNNMARRDNCDRWRGVPSKWAWRLTDAAGRSEVQSRDFVVVRSATRVDWLRGRQDNTLVLPTRASTCEKQFCAGQHAVWKRRADAQRYPVRFDVLDHESVVAQTRDSG
jgi:hypothetical protein